MLTTIEKDQIALKAKIADEKIADATRALVDVLDWLKDCDGDADHTAFENAAHRVYMKAFSATVGSGVLGFSAHLHGLSAGKRAIADIRESMCLLRYPMTREIADAFEAVLGSRHMSAVRDAQEWA